MTQTDKRRWSLLVSLNGMWWNWTVAVGLLVILVVLAPIVPRQWLAPVNLLFLVVLHLSHRAMRKRNNPSCSRLIQQVSVIILVTALMLMLLYVYGLTEGLELTGQPYSVKSPLLVILVTLPLAMIVTFCFWANRKEPVVCQKCKMRYGNAVEHGFIGWLFKHEWRYQTVLLFSLSLLLSVVDWWYYATHYVNTNLNSADMFFFIWLPMMVYVLVLVYMGSRYRSIEMCYCEGDLHHFITMPGRTTLRYLVIKGDKLLLKWGDTDDGLMGGELVKKFDTPAIMRTYYHEQDNISESRRLLKKFYNVDVMKLQLAYGSPDAMTSQNIFHYLVFLHDDVNIEETKLSGNWYEWPELVNMANANLVSGYVIAEFKRIYRVAMAWQKYDLNGRRVCRLRHYQPPFRLEDMKKWDINYEDYRWLHIYNYNEDKPLYVLRHLFKRKTVINKSCNQSDADGNGR